MAEHYDAVIIGAGQSGLGVSYYLKCSGISHCVLERGRIGEVWRSQRWGSFSMNSPNAITSLPGAPYTGPEPEGFMTGGEFIDTLERYARENDLPVKSHTAVTNLTRLDESNLYQTQTADETYLSPNVVVATSVQNVPRVPEMTKRIPSDLLQLHSSQYRGPSQLPDGPILVVGSGASGGQIAEDLIEAERTVFLAASAVPRLLRRYRGRDSYMWSYESGRHNEPFGAVPNRVIGRNLMGLVSGTRGGHVITLRSLAAQGVSLLGRLKDVRENYLIFEDDLEASIRFGEGEAEKTRLLFDEYIRRAGIMAPPHVPEWAETVSAELPDPPILSLDLGTLSTIIWCTGVDGDFSWLKLPVFDNAGSPRHIDGCTDLPGLYFIGLHWLSIRSSSFVIGASTDAPIIARHIISRVSGR